MDASQHPALSPPRRVEALAYIIERIRSSGTSPSNGEIANAMNPPVTGSRARQYVDQLVASGVLTRPVASRRGIRIANLELALQMIQDALGRSGWFHAPPLSELEPPCTIEQLPVLPFLELPPDPH